jgi:hypothetical protein
VPRYIKHRVSFLSPLDTLEISPLLFSKVIETSGIYIKRNKMKTKISLYGTETSHFESQVDVAFTAPPKDVLLLMYHFFMLLIQNLPRVVTGEKNSPTVAHACRKRRLKWVFGAWGYKWATPSPGDINMEILSSRLGVGAQG